MFIRTTQSFWISETRAYRPVVAAACLCLVHVGFRMLAFVHSLSPCLLIGLPLTFTWQAVPCWWLRARDMIVVRTFLIWQHWQCQHLSLASGRQLGLFHCLCLSRPSSLPSPPLPDRLGLYPYVDPKLSFSVSVQMCRLLFILCLQLIRLAAGMLRKSQKSLAANGSLSLIIVECSQQTSRMTKLMCLCYTFRGTDNFH